MAEYRINCDCFVDCHSNFYKSSGALGAHTIHSGKNLLRGEIDSGVWELSYFLSMYHKRKKDFIRFDNPTVTKNGQEVPFEEILDKSCYMDKSDPLFGTKQTVRKLIEKGVKKSRCPLTAVEIQTLFHLDEQRLDRPISQVGNERFRAMAAIGVATGKEWFCFPWLSRKMVEHYGLQLSFAVYLLEQLNKNIVLPVGYSFEEEHRKNFVKIVVNSWDPADLLCHAPEDEYQPEIDEIQRLLDATDDETVLASGIFDVFVKYFGEGTCNLSKDDCKLMAQQILAQVKFDADGK